MMDGEDPDARIVHRPSDRCGRRRQPAGLAQRDAMIDERVGRRAEPLPLPNGGDRIGVTEPATEPVEGIDRCGPADAVDPEARVALELLAGTHRVRPEDAVDATGIETEPTESPLELGHVLAPHHGGLEVQQPVPELVALLDQGTPRVGPTDPVRIEAVIGLERDDGALRPVGEGAVVGSGIETGSPQPRLQVAYVIASGTEAERADYRNSPSSWSSCPLPLAPTMRFAISPSLKTMSVGMLMTW